MTWIKAVAVTLILVALADRSRPQEDITVINTSHKGYDPGVPVLHNTDNQQKQVIEGREAMEELEVPIGRKKVKIKLKKKHKKMLKEMLMVGLLIKSALLPIAVGALKLLTAKAFMMTTMALGLALALTFRSAKEKHVTTEIINLVPKHGKHRSLVEDAPAMLSTFISNKYQQP